MVQGDALEMKAKREITCDDALAQAAEIDAAKNSGDQTVA